MRASQATNGQVSLVGFISLVFPPYISSLHQSTIFNQGELGQPGLSQRTHDQLLPLENHISLHDRLFFLSVFNIDFLLLRRNKKLLTLKILGDPPKEDVYWLEPPAEYQKHRDTPSTKNLLLFLRSTRNGRRPEFIILQYYITFIIINMLEMRMKK